MTKMLITIALLLGLVSFSVSINSSPQFEETVNGYPQALNGLRTEHWEFDASSVELEGASYSLEDGSNYLTYKGDTVSINFSLLSIPQSIGIIGVDVDGKSGGYKISYDGYGNPVTSFQFNGEGVKAQINLRVVKSDNSARLGFYTEDGEQEVFIFRGVVTEIK